jgi:hypothetical protein
MSLSIVNKMKHKLPVSAGIAVYAILALTPNTFAQEVEKAKTAASRVIYESRPWTGGTSADAQNASKAGATIPLSTWSFIATKSTGKKASTGTFVGTSPFAATLSGSTINAVVVPIVFSIGSSIFDPTAPNNCGVENGVSAENRLMASPLVLPVSNLTFNGVDVGNVQHTDGFMRAEFWSTVGGSAAYSNPISYSVAAPISMVTGTNGITSGSGCSLLGVVNESCLETQLASHLQAQTAARVVSTTKLVLFLMNNVVLSTMSPPTLPGTAGCCVVGYHSATGTTPQFYAVADYNTVPGIFKATDTMVASHEIAEFMNDPHQQQFEAVVAGDPDSGRFDAVIQEANENKLNAKYAYLNHLHAHGCGSASFAYVETVSGS